MIYVLFACDEWKTKDSMRLVGATTNFVALKKKVKQMIKDEEMEMIDKDKKFLLSEFNNISDINNAVKYCYIAETQNGAFDC